MSEPAKPTSEQAESYLAGYAREFLSKTARYREEFENTDSSALIFRLDDEFYALPTTVFREVVKYPKVHSIPHQREGAVLGLANFRGELLLCLSLKHLLGLSHLDAEPDAPAFLLVLAWRGALVGCPVDEVEGVHRFRKESLQSKPPDASAAPGLVLGIMDLENGVASVLSADAIFGLSSIVGQHRK